MANMWGLNESKEKVSILPLSDLAPKTVAVVAVTLNQLLADTITLYFKTKNYHWHVPGPNFRSYHLMFDEQADQLFATMDVLAERVRKLGAQTLKSVGQVAKLQSLKDDDEEWVTAIEMVRRLMKDNQKLAEQQRSAIALCDGSADYGSSNVLQGMLDETERRVWQLYMTQDDPGPELASSVEPDAPQIPGQ